MSNHFKRAFQWDLARQMERVDFMLKWIPKYAEWGYEELYLYLENAFDFPSVPGVGRKGSLSPRDMERIVGECERRGIKVVLDVPLMGHAQYLVEVPALRHLSEIRDANDKPLLSGQLCPLHDGTIELARKLLRDAQPFCTAGIVHVSLDESFDIGKCLRCRREIEEVGLGVHFGRYIQRLREVCRELNLRMGMWSDMLYYIPEAIPLIPKDIIQYDWFYYPFKKLPRIELYNFAEVDLTGALRKAGLDVYGCPCNGTFCYESLPPFIARLQNIIAWWHYARSRDAQGMMITSWMPNYASTELNTVNDAAAASLWLNPGVEDPRKMLELGWQRAFGKSARSATALSIASEKYPEAGYYRWQARTNWRALANEDQISATRNEERHYSQLARKASKQKAPVPLREMLVFRHYLSHKNLFLSEGSQLLFEARRQAGRGRELHRCVQKIAKLADGFDLVIRATLRSVRVIWKRSRPLTEANPNEQILRNDQKKLKELRTFLRKVSRQPLSIWEQNPLLGQWQLLFWVRNFAPALQGAAVEQMSEDGKWKTVHSLYSLEFTSDAAVPRADFRRHHSVAIDWDGNEPLKLRLAVRGLGQLELYNVRLTNGAETLFPTSVRHISGPAKNIAGLQRPSRPGAILGVPAPSKGFPIIDWSANQSWAEVHFGTPKQK